MVSMRNQYNSYKLIYEINSKNFCLYLKSVLDITL